MPTNLLAGQPKDLFAGSEEEGYNADLYSTDAY